MTKKLIAISLAVLVIGLFSTVAMAGVEGSFDFDISLEPQTTTAEAVGFDIDFEGSLILDVELSGLTFSNDLVFGVAGIEHYVTNLDTTLGALALTDEFWFATPYDADNVKLGDLQFVKKRVEAEITLAGLSLTNNIVWEDVMFGHPYTQLYTGTLQTPAYSMPDPVHRFGLGMTLSGETVSGIGVEAITGLSYDPQLTNEVKKYSADGAYAGKDWDNIDVQWPVGDVSAGATIKAHRTVQTGEVEDFRGPIIPSTFDVSAECYTGGFPVSEENAIDSANFTVSAVGIGAVTTPTTFTIEYTNETDHEQTNVACLIDEELETAPQFPEFSVEKINITDISVAGVTIDNSLEFRPTEPVSNTIDASFSLLDFLDVALSYEFGNVLTLEPGEATYTLSTDLVTVEITDANADLSLTAEDTVNVTASLPIQFLTLDVDLTSEVGTGMTDLELIGTLELNSTTFTADAVWADGPPLAFDTITYTLETTVDNLDFDATAEFSETALVEAGIGVGVDFAV